MQIISLFVFAALTGLGVLAALTGLLPWWGVAIVAALIAAPTMRFQSRVGGALRGLSSAVMVVVLMVGGFLVTKAIGL